MTFRITNNNKIEKAKGTNGERHTRDRIAAATRVVSCSRHRVAGEGIRPKRMIKSFVPCEMAS